MSGYEAHPDVADDLADIAEYIARNSSPDTAARVIDEILDAIALLAASPGIGHRRDDLTSRPLRFWPVHDYLIVCAPDQHVSSWHIALDNLPQGTFTPRIAARIRHRTPPWRFT